MRSWPSQDRGTDCANVLVIEEVIAGDEDVPREEAAHTEEEADEPHMAPVVLGGGRGVDGAIVPALVGVDEHDTVLGHRRGRGGSEHGASLGELSSRLSRLRRAPMAHRVLCALAIAALIQYASAAAANASYELQPAPPSTSGPPGITVRQWNATGSNNQTTQFTLAKISTASSPYYASHISPS